MMTRLRSLLTMALLTAFGSAAAPAHAQLDPAGGGTVVTVEGPTVRITVNVDVPIVDPAPDLPEHVRSYVEPGFAAAATYWNDALADLLKGECFSVEIDVVVKVIEFGQSAAGGGHDVNVLHDVDPHFDSPQLTTETTSDDTIQVFTANGTAYLPPWLFQVEPSLLAHELGHMIGLGDDYVRNADGSTVPLPGRDGTLMDSGDRVDRALADRIADLVRRSGKKLPECQWEGRGLVRETPLKDEHRELSRSADFAFRFTAHPDGSVTGMITLTYAAELTVERLPEAEVGIAGFDPKVGGRVTDPNPTRTFPLEGELDEEELTLRIATPEDQRRQIRFTMRADPGVSAGLAAGGAMRMVPGGSGRVQVIDIDMMPFTPFSGPGTVELGPDGPVAASFHESDEDSLTDWTAERLAPEGDAEPVG